MTDEPGYYDEEGGYGIRIENTLYILRESDDWYLNSSG